MPKHQTTRERVYKQIVRAGGRGEALCSLRAPSPSARLNQTPAQVAPRNLK